MLKPFLVLVLVFVPVFATAGGNADVIFDAPSVKPPERSIRAAFTSTVVQDILVSGAYEVEELSNDDAKALASAHGVTLPELTGEEVYGRPWVIIKAAIGLPNLLSAYAEIFVHRNWTAELGAGAGLLPTVFEGSIRWRPDATCWDCEGKNFFSIGFGVDPSVYFGGGEGSNAKLGVMVTATVDLTYIHRFAKHFGIMVGSRAGIGLVTEFGGSRSWTNLEPALKVNLLQAGFVF